MSDGFMCAKTKEGADISVKKEKLWEHSLALTASEV